MVIASLMVEFVARWSNALTGAAGDHSGRVRRKRSGRTGLRGIRAQQGEQQHSPARELASRGRSRARPGDWP